MNLIRQTFNKKSVFIGYLTAGDGGVAHSIACASALIAGGVDILEIGVPFSDPIADGPIIQRAMQRALNAGITLVEVWQIIAGIKKKHPTIPIILFSYFNPILAAMQNNFLQQATQTQLDAILIVDLPLEEAAHSYAAMQKSAVLPIHIITPSTPLERIAQLNKLNETFLYYACRKGTTGLQNHLPENFKQQLSTIKTVTSAPIAVGFGISNRVTAQKALSIADGFIVGSLFVKAIEDGIDAAELQLVAASIDPRIIQNIDPS